MKKVRIGLGLSIICIVIFIFGGYRFTPLAAAKANSFVTKDYELIGEYKNDTSIFYLFKNDGQQHYRTVYVNQNNLIYRSNYSNIFPYSNDDLQTIGGMSIQDENEAATVLIIHSLDENVASIRLESDFGIETKEILKDEIAYFLLPFAKQIDQLNAVALDKNGNKLYYYGYESNNSFNNLKWYKIEN
ncbi:hypothetical protein ACIQZG_22815 [Lysinibacillus sp. NPDC096418]|uniref:hypothetical protein n=1 Tax=Lysinibacillus sp. NPDC096418 TaxID=3364138 RepID=UPI0037F7D484